MSENDPPATNRIDHDDPRANMYGIIPCPRCNGRHRWPTRPDHQTQPNMILCDRCGFAEPRQEGAAP